MDNANFMAYLGVLIFIILVIGGIIYAQRAAKKEEERRIIFNKCKRLTNRSVEVWDIIQDAKDYVANAGIIDVLVHYYSYILNQRESLAPQHDTGALIAKADSFKTQYNPNDPTLILNNDMEIKRCKTTFAQVSKILKIASQKHFIHNEDAATLDQQLQKTLLNLLVNSYEKLGDIAGQNKKPAVAVNYYKYAKKLLIESDITYDGKHQHIRDITEKTQTLFGKTVQEELDKKNESLKFNNDFGLPEDLDVMQGKARKKD